MKESGEMYLETILLLKKKKSFVRSIDVAEEMSHSKSSVSRAISILKKDKFIEIDKDGLISFTKKGKDKANKIYERHQVLTKALIKLGVNDSSAETDACKIEHVISDDTFSVLKDFINK